ncbi:DUF2061 domain-containing protein [Qipengyuania seohaensis]|uniref:DUF2061 domain-containing protein n=1 Tax=Qipengyuania seohaensis TaxID=266951 RepID=UPI001E312061|nr:DUF2061 domain-containing protein [Qipengyuania seohaensis]
MTKRRSVAKAISWRVVGTLDTLILSYVLITYLGPFFGAEIPQDEALETAGLIAITEVLTKFVLYFLHERAWASASWGLNWSDGKRRESVTRSAAKTGLWRTIASTDTFLLAWFFTGSAATAASIGGLEIVSKLILYMIHERVWSRISFGLAIHQT